MDKATLKYLQGALACYVVVFIGVIIFIVSNTFLPMDFQNAGAFGDTLAGLSAVFIGSLGIIFTFLAFWVQFQANEQTKKDLQLERFENKFYELLRLQRANVEEMNIANRVMGRKCFTRLFSELRYCFMIVSDQYNAANPEQKELYNQAPMDLLKFAYTIFFWGIGPNSEKQFSSVFDEAQKQLFKDCKKRMEELQKQYVAKKNEFPDANYYSFDVPLTLSPDDRTLEFYYFPFNGHSDRLGHYYRHLFQSVKYIIEQQDSFINFEMKYSYIKTLRAQLSNHEQLMLYYNGVAWFEQKWKLAFTDYRLIKNLPLGMADFGLRPEDKFEDDIRRLNLKNIKMFELQRS